MAQFESTSRTNFFKVTDVEALRAALATFPLVVEVHHDEPFYVCIEPSDGQDSWPADNDEYEQFSWEEHVCPFIAPGAVCIFQEVGAEKSRYLLGVAYAYTSDGEVGKVDLDSIYEQVSRSLSIPLGDIARVQYSELPASYAAGRERAVDS